MADTRDILDDYPELKFPAGRGAASPAEIARKWGVTIPHVIELLDDGRLAALDMTGVGNKTDRQCMRIPLSAYYAETRARLKGNWRPPHRPDPKQPDLPGIH